MGESAVVRDRILDAARQQFAARGYAATSLREVATAAGVTKPMVYYYFGSKEGLYRTLLHNVQEQFRAILQAADSAGADTRARLVALVRGHAQLAAKRRDMQLWLAATLGPPGGVPKMEMNRELEAAGQVQLARIITDGITKGELAAGDAELITLAIRGAITVFYAVALEHVPGPSMLDPNLPERLVELLLTGLRGPGVPAPASHER